MSPSLEEPVAAALDTALKKKPELVAPEPGKSSSASKVERY